MVKALDSGRLMPIGGIVTWAHMHMHKRPGACCQAVMPLTSHYACGLGLMACIKACRLSNLTNVHYIGSVQ